MQCLASCATRVKQVSSIAFDCIPDHAALGILRYPSQTGQFDRLELTHLTQVAQGSKHCMAWDAIEGNRTHPFASGSAIA